MRKMFMAILALAGAASLIAPLRAYAQEGEGVMIKQLHDKWEVTRAARLRTSDSSDPDTVWIGHIYDAAWSAGGKMVPGGYGPYKVGRGLNHPTRLGSGGANGTTSVGDNGAWDFDRYQLTEKDSLQGWWPMERPFLGSTTAFPDYRRAFYGLDMGNNINYVIPQGAPKRTFGVVGLWHTDRGNLTTYSPSDSLGGVTGTVAGRTNVQPVLWSPTECGGAGSTRSAWCGLRSHGDLSHRDDVNLGGTGNPFDASLIQYQGNNGFNFAGSISANGTDANYPGYISQLDQMLYRDVDLAEGDGLNISFNYSTNMSVGAQTATPGQVTGWFDKDPISNAQVGVGSTALPMSDGNFISSSLATPVGIIDSFMVYIGSPVDDNNVTFSADLFVGVNQITSVYDKKRRWFSEVLRIVRATGAPATTPSTIIGKEIFTAFGEHVAGPKSFTILASDPALVAIKAVDGPSNGGRVRIVFRVKTNRGWDDENTGNTGVDYASGTRGAAIVDNVVVNGWAAANGDFESPNSINNDTAISATAAWKSTGKPPQTFFHIHKIAGPGSPLDFRDPCGGVDSPNRQCNMYGNVATPGNHDATGDKEGGEFGSNLQDAQRFMISPTMNLSATSNGVYNDMGIDDEVARTTGDYFTLYSIYTAGMVDPAVSTAGLEGWGWQAYPSRQKNGSISWGDARVSGFFGYSDPRQCGESFINGGAKAQSLIRTTNAQNRPDSLRIYVLRASRCFLTPTLTAAECNPTTGEHVGSYFDNIACALIDAPPPASISSFPWNYLNDAFPSNSNIGLLPAGFDTCAAQVRIGLNIASPVGTTLRNSISGDSLVIAAGGSTTRMDLVFRILPGPGNYVTVGVRSSGVARRPAARTPTLPPTPYGVGTLAVPGDGTFFGTYLGNTGEFGNKFADAGTGDANSAHPIVSGVRRWSQNVWNSARMDTVENNLFPTSVDGTQVGLGPGFWAGMYHEADPKFGTLGQLKNRCNMVIPQGTPNSTNIECNNSDWTNYGAGSGYPAGGEAPDFSPGRTREYTKIIPDGLLTPGSHVEYFYRKSDAATPLVFELGPDTNFVFQDAEGGSDGHRWQEFGVLPDRWKDGAWSIADRNAPSPACMLYVDYADGRGDETVWVSVADSIGATAQARFGAHNGWHARGDQDITVAIATDPTIAVYAHGGQPGTVWDMFGSKAVESGTAAVSMGSRGAALGTGLRTGKDNLNGPTGDMLRQYYRTMLFLQGDLGKSTLGPITDRGDNDIAMLQDFASGVGGTARPRALWFGGRSFVESQNVGITAHPGFTASFFGSGLVSGDYRAFTGNVNDVVDLTTFSPTDSTGNIYGLNNFCTFTNDLLSLAGTGAMAAKYPDAGLPGGNPRIASVYAPSNLGGAGTHPYVSLVDGWRETSIGGRNTVTTPGRLAYFFNVYSRLFGALNCPLAPGAPVSVGENPNSALVNFLALRSENPFRSDKAKISFGITRKEKVELKVYDVTGRLVKTLANREFDAGSHDLFWDGTNDEGQLVSRGVYFYQLRTPSFVSQKKLALLKN